jgi:hypothetical protein
MGNDCLLELENLVCGNKKIIELSADSSIRFREDIVEKLNELMTTLLPGCWLEGEFVDKDSSDYLIYELHPSGSNETLSFSSITLFDFGDKLRLIRV